VVIGLGRNVQKFDLLEFNDSWGWIGCRGIRSRTGFSATLHTPANDF
jgi:hypothetical protein